MTVPLPAQGDTSWYDWAQDVHDAVTVDLPAVEMAGALTRLGGSARIRAMADVPAYAPTVMSSPPTVTQAATATALLTQTVASTVGRWSANLNPTPTVAGTVEPRGGTAPNGGVYTQPRATMLAFDTDAESFDFIVKATSTLRYRLWVNEQAATTGLVALPSATNAKAYVNVDFGSASPGNLRRIILEVEDLTNPVSVYGLGIKPIRTLVYPGISSPRVLIVGDSYAQGTGATFESYGYARTMGRLMGWADTWLMAMGGTGLVKDADPTWVGRYSTRLAPDVIPADPDLVIIQGSINDDADAATVGAALTSYVTTLRASLPEVPIVVFSPLYIGAPFASSLTTNTNMKAAAAALDLPYVDLMAPSPFSGNGNTGAPDGLGNADVYRSTDNVHPNNEGHQMLGRIAAGQLARLLGLPL